MGAKIRVFPQANFPALGRCLLEAYNDPPQKFMHIHVPINEPGEKAYGNALEIVTERLKLWHSLAPTSYWQKVVDGETGKVAGGASWHIYHSNPFIEMEDMEVTWFPNDGSRKFAEQWLQLCTLRRPKAGQRPQILMAAIGSAVKHNHRQRFGV